MERTASFDNKVWLHVAGWALFFLIPFLLVPVHELSELWRERASLISMCLRNILWIGLFYANLLYLAPVILKARGVAQFLVLLALAVIIVSWINSRIGFFFFSRMAPPDFHRMPPPPEGMGRMPRPFRHFEFGPPGPYFSNFLISVIVASVSTSLALWTDWARARAAEQERAIQKLASELSVLKLQVSPHFLFNTLNNIRWLIRSRSEQAEAAVVKLSQLLRYILYHTQPETVPLSQELEHIEDYIALQKLRLPTPGSLSFRLDGDPAGKQIVPLLFIPLIENVFKYGDFATEGANSIAISITDDHVSLRTRNAISFQGDGKSATESGIGLSNVRKRLSLHYPGSHRLTIRESEGIYELELLITL